LASVFPALATRSGAAPYAVNLSSLLHHRRCSVCRFDIFRFEYDIAYSKHSTTTLPTASIRQHHHHDSATVRLHRPRHARTSFGALTRDMQDYNVKARLESLPDSMNRLDTRGLLTKKLQMGPRYSPTWFSVQGRSPLEGYTKPARPSTPTWSRRQVTPCKP
jgi:hypothetical protein